MTAVLALVLLAAGFQPARLIDGEAPRPSPQTVGWEEAVLRARVTAAGTVDTVEVLDGTEPLASGVRRAVRQWRFEPAMDGGRAVATEVLIAAVYRPPALYDVPPFRGVSIRPVPGPDRIPVPASMSAPSFPATSRGDGVVVVEVLLDANGDVRSAAALHSSARAFNASAVRAALGWRFHPARRADAPAAAHAYLIFGFRQPVVGPRPVP